MLRITERLSGDGAPALRLEGSVAGRWVEELRREVGARYHLDGRPVVIDLERVTYIDGAGMAFFAEAASRIYLSNCSLFAAEQLKDVLARQQMVRR